MYMSQLTRLPDIVFQLLCLLRVLTNLKKQLAREEGIRRHCEDQAEDLSDAVLRASDREAAAAAMKIRSENEIQDYAAKLAASQARCISATWCPVSHATLPQL